MTTIERSREADMFLEARQHVAPEVVSACQGWTAHEVTAHLTGIAAELTRHLEPYLDGRPVPATRSFEDVAVVVESGRATLELAGAEADEPHVELDAAARTLLIWGRRAGGRGRVRSFLSQPALARPQALLSGY
jgi:hypothetical protein